MNRYFRRKVVTTVIFVIIILSGFVINLKRNKASLWKEVKEGNNFGDTVLAIDGIVNENVVARYQLIDAYGYLQRLMAKNEENNFEVIKDKNRFLHYTYFGAKVKDTENLVKRTLQYKESIKNKDTQFLYVMTPDKVIDGYTEFDSGLPYHYANETADLFLSNLDRNKISYIDLRDNITNSGIELSELFYKTDHYWKIKTEDSYIGSMARKAGIIYSGVDDFTLIYPKFFTDYIYESSIFDYNQKVTGRFEQSLINFENLRNQGQMYDVKEDKYSSYLYGNKGIAHITNQLNTKGPKILIVKDSFMVPVAAFLSSVCSEIYLVDPRYYEGDIIEYTNSIPDLDYVMVSFTPQDLTEEFLTLS